IADRLVDDQKQAIVKAVAEGSPAAWNDIQPGDVMLKVGEYTIQSAAELASVLKTYQADFQRVRGISVQFTGDRPDARGRIYAEFKVQSGEPPMSQPPAPSLHVIDKSAERSPPKWRMYFFYSPSSGPALKAKSIVEAVIKQFPDVDIVEIDVSKE